TTSGRSAPLAVWFGAAALWEYTQKSPVDQVGRLVAARAGSARNPKVRTSRITTPTAKPRPEECIHPPGWAEYRLGYEPAGSLRRTFIPDLPLAGPEDSMPGVIKTEMEDRLAVVTINRPEA